MDSDILLSIIIPLYNSERFVHDTVFRIFDSLDKKYYDKIEILLVDDGSRDNTEQISCLLAKQFYNIKYFKKNNGGIADARNYGIKKAKGHFLFFHDHDDSVYKNDFNDIIKLILDKKYDVYFFEARMKKNNQVSELVLNKEIANNDMSNENLCNNLLLDLQISKKRNNYVSYIGYIWTLIISKEYVISHSIIFRSFLNYEDDFLFVLQLLLCKPNVYISKLILYVWTINEGSTSHVGVFDENLPSKITYALEYIQTLCESSNFYDKRNLLKNIRWMFWHNYVISFCLFKKRASISVFKKQIKKYNIRKSVLEADDILLSGGRKLYHHLFKLKFYGMIYILLRLRRILKRG